MSEELDDTLEHHGVKGMKWGRRKDRSSPHPDYSSTAHLRGRKVNELSNEQLKKLTTRMNLEQQYSRLNPTKKAVGKAAIASIIGAGATGITLYNMYNSPAGKAAMKAGKNAYYKGLFIAGVRKAITTGK